MGGAPKESGGATTGEAPVAPTGGETTAEVLLAPPGMNTVKLAATGGGVGVVPTP